MSLKLVLSVVVVGVWLGTTTVTGFRFPRVPIKVPNGALVEHVPQDLTCNYMPKSRRSETIVKVTWIYKYPDDQKSFFVNHIQSGGKDLPPQDVIDVDLGSSSDKVVRMTLLEDKNEEDGQDLEICCKVEALADNRGTVHKVSKEKCEKVWVVSGGDRSGNLFPTSNALSVISSDPDVSVGDAVETIECKTRRGGPTPHPKLIVLINGIEMPTSTVSVGDIASAKYSGLTIIESHFGPRRRIHRTHPELSPNEILLECKAMYGKHLAGQTNSTIYKTGTYTRPQPPIEVTVAPTRDPGTQVNEPRQPRQFWLNADVHARHGEVPCHGYILLEEGTGGQGAILRGDVDEETLSHLEETIVTGENRRESQEDVIEVLNVLGYHGYVVMAMTKNSDNRLVWTLERKYFEFHRDEL